MIPRNFLSTIFTEDNKTYHTLVNCEMVVAFTCISQTEHGKGYEMHLSSGTIIKVSEPMMKKYIVWLSSEDG